MCVCVCANTFIFVAVQYSFLYYLILSMLISLILLLTLFCVQYLTLDLIDTAMFMVIHVFVNGSYCTIFYNHKIFILIK